MQTSQLNKGKADAGREIKRANLARVRWAGRLLASALVAFASVSAIAAPTTHSLRDYFDGLGASYPVQQLSNEWTFHAGGSGDFLIAPFGQNYYGPVSYQQIGSPVDVGTSGCTPGYCPGNPSTTLATFDGVFVHPGASTTTSAVFRAHQDMVLDSIELWSEMVGNGNNGNGFHVEVSAIVGGNAMAIGSLNFDYSSTLTLKDLRVFTPGWVLHNGDLVQVSYGNNGSYLYDHGNAEVRIVTSDVAGEPGVLPEPGSWALSVLALLGVWGLRRPRRNF